MGPVCSDAEIVEGCRRGDAVARQALFERHHRQLFRFLVAQCADASLAEDLVQETFLKAYGAIGSFRGQAKLSSWLTRIGLNCFYEHVRRAGVHRRAIEPEVTAPATSGPLHWCVPRDAEQDGEIERSDLLRRGLAGLTDADRAVVLLHDLLGYRYEEIATILEIAPGTVGSRLHRARDRLRRLLLEVSGPLEETRGGVDPINESDAETPAVGGRSQRVRLGSTMLWSRR